MINEKLPPFSTKKFINNIVSELLENKEELRKHAFRVFNDRNEKGEYVKLGSTEMKLDIIKSYLSESGQTVPDLSDIDKNIVSPLFGEIASLHAEFFNEKKKNDEWRKRAIRESYHNEQIMKKPGTNEDY